MLNQLRTITVGYDFSAGGRTAVRAALALAGGAGARVHIVTSLPGAIDDGADSLGNDPLGLNLGADVLTQVEAQMRSTLADELVDGVGTTFEAGFARPAKLVVDAAHDRDADLIVLGAVGRETDPDRGIGVDAMKIVRRSTLPVLVVPAGVPWPPRNILCAVDFSEASERALDAAVATSAALNARLTVLHVVETASDVDWGVLGVPAPVPTSDAIARASHRLNALLEARRAGPLVTPVVVEGRAAEAVAERTATDDVDLLVIGSIGRNPVAEALVGGTTERVLRKMPCAVLATKADSFVLHRSDD